MKIDEHKKLKSGSAQSYARLKTKASKYQGEEGKTPVTTTGPEGLTSRAGGEPKLMLPKNKNKP